MLKPGSVQLIPVQHKPINQITSIKPVQYNFSYISISYLWVSDVSTTLFERISKYSVV